MKVSHKFGVRLPLEKAYKSERKLQLWSFRSDKRNKSPLSNDIYDTANLYFPETICRINEFPTGKKRQEMAGK